MDLTPLYLALLGSGGYALHFYVKHTAGKVADEKIKEHSQNCKKTDVLTAQMELVIKGQTELNQKSDRILDHLLSKGG